MSIAVSFHPTRSSRDELKKLVRELGFTPSGRLWDWPKGSLHFHWFDEVDYQSFDGVEATICPPSEDAKATLGNCTWALHTRTRASASPADREQQNNLIRLAQARFGGSFYNDCFGRNRYTKVTPDARDAPTRGIYLAYEIVTDNIRAVRFALPEPQKSLERLVGTKLEPLSHADPAHVLYNALVPFAVAALEHFFSRCFKILLHTNRKCRSDYNTRPQRSRCQTFYRCSQEPRPSRTLLQIGTASRASIAFTLHSLSGSTSTSGKSFADGEGWEQGYRI